MTSIANGESGLSVRTKLNAALAVTDAVSFATRAAFVSANTATPGLGLTDGQIAVAGGYEYRRLASSTAISDLAGWVPNGEVTPQHFGAVGDGATDDRPAFVALNTYGGDVYLPKPPVAYNVATAINLDKPAITVDPTASWEALTDTGNITWNTNLFTQQDPPVPVHRFNGRAFFGDAAHEMAGGWAGSTTDDRGPLAWYAKQTPIFGGYTHRDATVAVANGKGTTALALSTRSSQQWNSAWDAPIGLGIFVWNDGNGEAWSSTWGGIIEGRASQLEGNTFGLEVALGNISGVSKKITPYNWNTGDGGGVHGFWMQGAGDASMGTPSDAPNNSAMVILKGSSNTTLDGGWRAGIVFTEDALTGTDGSAASTTFAEAVVMGRNQRVCWYEPTTEALAFSITSDHTDLSAPTRLQGFARDGGGGLVTGIELVRQTDNIAVFSIRSAATNNTTSAVLQASAGTIRLQGEGSATNIDVFLSPKGTGRVRFGTRTASSDVPVTGYIEILDSGGNVRRLAVVG